MKKILYEKRTFLISIGIITLLFYVSATLTHFSATESFKSFPKAFHWMATEFIPNESSLSKLPNILEKLFNTILISVAATFIASLFAFFTALTGSKTTQIHEGLGLITRFLASVLRNVPLVAWAMVLLFSFGQSALTGFIALFLVTFGFLVRAFIETIDEASSSSVEALKATGAGYLHIILQGVLPSSLPQMISWVLFLIETNVRSSTLIGILTGTGIGFTFNMYYRNMNYPTASLVMLMVVLAVIFIELLSNQIRRVIL